MLEFVAILEVMTIMTGLFFLRKGRPVILYVVLASIILATLNENVIIHHSKHWWGISRNIFYNVFSFADIAAWSFVFAKLFAGNRLAQRITVAGTFMIVSYSLIEIQQAPQHLHVASLMWWSAFVVILSLVYFRQIMKKEYHLLQSDPGFWLCAGAICFNAIFFVNLVTMADREYWTNSGTALIFDILQCAAILLYYLFICSAFIVYYYNHRQSAHQALSSGQDC